MITNYIKLALRGMMRNKFFSAISLFGISFTLAILMLVVSMIETEAGNTKPLTKKDRIVLLTQHHMFRQFYDTIYTYDTTYMSGLPVIDTSFKLVEAGSNNSNNSFAWSFLDKHFSDVPSVENHTFFSTGGSFNAYVNNSKVELDVAYIDAAFWDILDFDFIEGYAFGPEAVDQEEQIAIITTELAQDYFGKNSDVIDEEIYMDGRTFKVKGVIHPPGVSLLSSNIYVPHTIDKPTNALHEEIGLGGFRGMLLAAPGKSTKQVKQEVDMINSTLEVHPSRSDNYNEVKAKNYSYHEAYADRVMDLDEPEDSLRYLKYILIGLVAFFIILPTLNLINLNVSRIMERSAEIGVRKAFGANQVNILGQFIIENIIQTTIGALLGLLLAIGLIHLLNDSGALGDIHLKLNVQFFIYSVVLALVFGILSGLLPAWRMSRIHIVNALKQHKI